jgi:hypothetical protein
VELSAGHRLTPKNNSAFQLPQVAQWMNFSFRTLKVGLFLNQIRKWLKPSRGTGTLQKYLTILKTIQLRMFIFKCQDLVAIESNLMRTALFHFPLHCIKLGSATSILTVLSSTGCISLLGLMSKRGLHTEWIIFLSWSLPRSHALMKQSWQRILINYTTSHLQPIIRTAKLSIQAVKSPS